MWDLPLIMLYMKHTSSFLPPIPALFQPHQVIALEGLLFNSKDEIKTHVLWEKKTWNIFYQKLKGKKKLRRT